MADVTQATHAELLSLLGDPHAPAQPGTLSDSLALRADLGEYFSSREQVLSVLGVDIYGYSRLSAEPQRLVPLALRWILDSAIQIATANDPMLFARYDFYKHLVPTGDGWFLMFATPLHAVAFAAYFQGVLEGYNSGFFYPQLLALVGPLTLRFALTRDVVVNLDNNWFGSGIISNARIIARDTLNRFLIDASTVRWFAERIGTIESLIAVVSASLSRLIDAEPGGESDRSLLFSSSTDDVHNLNAFKSVHLQKVGVVTAKGSVIDLYNFYIQVRLVHQRIAPAYIIRPVVITVGNLNTAGITA